ncbi:MAG: hypothetical protein AB8H80_08710 [Planctomycetota bacterium]
MNTRRATMLALIAPMAMAACVHQINDNQFQHALTLQWDGEPYCGLEPHPQAKSIPDDGLTNFSVQIDEIAARIKDEKPERVLVFIHGGLNTIGKALARTNDVTKACAVWNAKPENRGDTVYPIFINWHSGFVTYWDRLARIREGRAAHGLWTAITWPFILVADFGRALARLPATTVTETRKSITNSPLLRSVMPAPADWPASSIAIDNRYERNLGTSIVDGLTQIVPGVLRPATMLLSDALLYDSYRMMLRRMDMMFHTEADFARASTESGEHPASGAVSLLMNRLQELQAGKEFQGKITLMGHSLGTIAINEILRRNPQLPVNDIVYMAAACTARDFADTVPPYLQEHTETKFYSLCLHPFAETNEASAFSALPRGSLLDWLDSYALIVNTPFDLTFGKWNNSMHILPLIGLADTVRERIHIKGFPVSGTEYPVKHGEFDDFLFWDRDFWDPAFRTGVGHHADLLKSPSQATR